MVDFTVLTMVSMRSVSPVSKVVPFYLYENLTYWCPGEDSGTITGSTSVSIWDGGFAVNMALPASHQ